MLLLNCLNSYAQKINDDIPSTGNLIKSDTTFVSIDINYIRLANAKLLERQYLLKSIEYKDSIIIDYKNYIAEQEKINKDFQNKIIEANKLNEKLNKNIERKRKALIVTTSVAATAVLGLVLISIAN